MGGNPALNQSEARLSSTLLDPTARGEASQKGNISYLVVATETSGSAEHCQILFHNISLSLHLYQSPHTTSLFFGLDIRMATLYSNLSFPAAQSIPSPGTYEDFP
jgi:hypothetical protein